ncbi:MAG TPA: penicillin-binding transpeptidase domain-containing protein, partial [Saprospiraceae bacterium]|nr:penicillin-binding transpeptidase domain-containing protein [Saprospiraceae bacterium]
GAYVTFANNGVYNKPTFITRIEDRNGRVIYQEMPQERTALPPNANYVMVEMLRYSGTGLFGVKSDVGGKTGTTNDYVDGWFMGVNPQLVVGTWTGGEDRWIRFRSIGEGQGAHMAKPFFREFIKRLEADPNSS